MISPVRNVIKDADKVARRVGDLFRVWTPTIEANYHARWLYFRRLYYGYRPVSPVDPLRSNVHLPLAQSAVDTILPRIMQSLFATEPPIHGDPYVADIERQITSEAIENLIWRNWRRTNRWMSACMAAKDGLTTGIGFEKMRWVVEEADDGTVMKDRPEWRRVSNFDLTWDPATDYNFSDTPVIHWRAMHLSDARDMARLGGDIKNIDKIMEYSNENKLYTLNSLYESLGLRGPIFDNQSRFYGPEHDDPWIVVLEYWDDEYTVTVDPSSNAVIAPPRRNPYRFKPFIAWQCNPTGDFMVGKGPIETLASLQEAANNYENALQDNAIISVHKMFLVDDTTKLKETDFIPRPNGIIKVNAREGKDIRNLVTPLDTQPPSQAGNDTLERINSWYERGIGVNPLMQGAGPQRTGTYGGQALQVKESSMRSFLDTTNWAEQCIARSAWMEFVAMKRFYEEYTMVGMTGRNVPTKEVERFFPPVSRDQAGNPYILIGPKLFESVGDDELAFQPTGSQGLALKENVQNQLMTLMGEISQDPYIGAQPMPTSNPAAVEMMMTLRLREISVTDIPGKEQVIRSVQNAYLLALQKAQQAQMMEQQQMMMPPPQPGQEGQPGQASQPAPPQAPQPIDMRVPMEQQAPEGPESPPMPEAIQ